MRRRLFLSCVAVVFGALVLGNQELDAAETYRVSGPHTHENLAIYLVKGSGSNGAVPLTLEEALEGGSVKVHETGDVNQLAIENLGEVPVFVQSGDIVKGGQQDRVLTVSLLLPPHSSRISIGSFCVEQGRWNARGDEQADGFASAAYALPSREAKIAMKAPSKSAAANVSSSAGSAPQDVGKRQQEVWSSVADIQDKLSKTLGDRVAAKESPSSLQLALEDSKLERARRAYFDALRAVGEEDPHTIGYVFVINGKVNSADIYASNGLFRKMWPKLLRASAAEAIAEVGAEENKAPPPAAAIKDFLLTAERGKAVADKLTDHVELETREGADALFFETRSAKGTWLHRNYLAK